MLMKNLLLGIVLGVALLSGYLLLPELRKGL